MLPGSGRNHHLSTINDGCSGRYAPATLRQPSHRFFIHIARSLTDLSNPSVIQSVRMLFSARILNHERRRRQEVLRESDSVVFIDGSLIEDGTL